MQNILRAGAGRNKLRIKGSNGRVTVYRSNNPNKPFKKVRRKGQYAKMNMPNARFSSLPNALLEI